MPDTVSFIIAGEERITCSKKCKKVCKFAYMVKKGYSENEIMRAFETMLRKKLDKRNS